MSHAATLQPHDTHAHGGHHGADIRHLLRTENITPASGSGAKGSAFLIAGLIAAALALGVGFTGVGGVTLKHALASYLVGVMGVLAICLGATFFVLVFHLMQAGWTATLRRQFENVMSFLPYAWLLLLPVVGVELVKHGVLFRWMSPDMAGDLVLNKKAGFFYWPGAIGHGLPLFFLLRTFIYGGFWFFLTRRLISLSREQDATGSVEPSAKARFTAAWGMPVFALSTAFVAFDYMMSLDFRFFSTMWGVYYFAGAAFSAVAVVTFLLTRLRGSGKLQGVVTSEHFHDLGKLMFSFTVFWAYIAFSQYFLYWYANLPEETAYFQHRYQGPWLYLGVFLMVGHFAVPFLLMISRIPKRNPATIGVLALWAVLVHFADIFWIVRPMVRTGPDLDAPVPTMGYLVDALAIVGVLLVFAGFVTRRVGSSPLVAVNDPYIHEGLSHRNYV